MLDYRLTNKIHADEQIRRYIAAKERLITLLEEHRQDWSTRPSRGAWTPASGSSPPEWSG